MNTVWAGTIDTPQMVQVINQVPSESLFQKIVVGAIITIISGVTLYLIKRKLK